MQELTQYRQANRKVYDLGNGQHKASFTSGPRHYRDGGEWVDYNIDFSESAQSYDLDTGAPVKVKVRKNNLDRFITIKWSNDCKLEQGYLAVEVDGVEVALGANGQRLKERRNKVAWPIAQGIKAVVRMDNDRVVAYTRFNNPCESFRIKKQIYLTGLTCSNTIDGNQYTPDAEGAFNFVDASNEVKFRLTAPKMNKDDGEDDRNVKHSLNTNLVYRKWANRGLTAEDFPLMVDTDVTYGMTNNYWWVLEYALTNQTSNNWSTARGAASSTGAYGSGANRSTACHNFAPSAGRYTVYLGRWFVPFPISVPAGADVTAASIRWYTTAINTAPTLCVQESTKTYIDSTGAKTAYDEFTGNSFGTTLVSGAGEQEINFDSAGVAYIETCNAGDDIVRLCVRNYTYDYLNVDPYASINGQTFDYDYYSGYPMVLDVTYASSTAYSLTADDGTFELTGKSTTLTRGYADSLTASSFSLTGKDATLTRGYSDTLTTSTTALTGKDATLTRGYLDSLTTSTTAVTGKDATLTRGYADQLTTLIVALTGNDITTARGYVDTLTKAETTITLKDAALNVHYVIGLDAGGYTITGHDATTGMQFTLISGAGGYTLTGNAINEGVMSNLISAISDIGDLTKYYTSDIGSLTIEKTSDIGGLEIAAESAIGDLTISAASEIGALNFERNSYL